ncbi:MAG: hypothetical protein ACRDY6_20380 [Acidimicrobiia bacterium]
MSALEDVGARIDDPATPYLAARVRARLETEAALTTAAPSRRVWFAFAGVALAVVLSMVLAFSPATRRAVAGWLGLRGVEIERVSTPPPTALGGDLDLGEPVTLRQAERRADFDLVLPPEDRFGPPDELYFADSPSGGRVDVLYRSGSTLPILLTEFRGDTEAPIIRKTVGDDVVVEPVTIDGREGVWLEGGPHTVTFLDEDGEPVVDHTRLAGNTLIWERGSLTLRLESELTKEVAIEIAEVVVSPSR